MLPEHTSARDRAGPLASARILVVDDHAFSVSLIKDVLFAAGAGSVQTAPDGARAIRMLRLANPDLILTDWKMPAMDGLVFTQTIRQAERAPDPRVPNPQVPVVLLSGHASAKAVQEARLAGVNEVVVKPFSTAALIERMVAAMTKPRAFVVTEAYIGPDRRRRADDEAPVRRRRSDLLAEAKNVDGLSEAKRSSVLRLVQTGLNAVTAADEGGSFSHLRRS